MSATVKHHWMEDANRVHEGDYIGECENGDLWVQRDVFVRGIPGDKWERFNPRRLAHWVTYWRSRRAGRVVWLARVGTGAEADRG